MKLIYKERGGIQFSTIIGPLNIPFPFALFELYEDSIVITVLPKDILSKIFLPLYLIGLLFHLHKRYIFPLKNIHYITPSYGFALFERGIKIVHHADAPQTHYLLDL